MSGRGVRTMLLVLCALGMGTLGAADGDAPALRLEVEPREATLGERIEARLEVAAASDAEVERPALGARLGPFVVTDVSWERIEAPDAEQRWLWHGMLAAYETGDLEIPPINVKVKGPDGESMLKTLSVSVTIRSVIPPDEENPEIADNKAQVSVPPEYGPLVLALGGLALLLVVSSLGWWLHRRYGQRFAAVPTPEDPFRRLPPHVWVYGELQRLLERRLAESGEVGVFFEELSRILKLYLGGRYRLDLMERTTAEVPGELKQAGAPHDAGWTAREVLDLCDRVKFAKEAPDAEACRASVEDTYQIVDATKPREAEAERGAA